MTECTSIGFGEWLKTPAGRYVLDWEQSHLDTAVADLFGFHALQLGMLELDALRANRMPHRWLATDLAGWPETERQADALGAAPRPALHCDFDALPFDAASLDLVVLPHALELARDPHRVLREVERVLMPEGRVVVAGFNPSSPWGWRQRAGRLRRSLGVASSNDLYLPSAGEFMPSGRLRDWLRLLGFEIEAGRFGCYRWPVASARWLDRLGWMDAVGERWWPVFGALYFVVAVKRVRGLRLVGAVRAQRVPTSAAPAPVAVAQHRQSAPHYEEETG